MNEISMDYYKITLEDREENLQRLQLEGSLDSKAMEAGPHKIYLIHYERAILYVGECTRSFKDRLAFGVNRYNQWKRTGKTKNGYRGYKWINPDSNPHRELSAFIATFQIAPKEGRDFVEAVEGELVFLIRQETSKWPEYQNEIHFHNQMGALEVARKIFHAFKIGDIQTITFD